LIRRRTVFFVGLSQLVCWGASYYLIGVFGPAMAAESGLSASVVYGGFSAALLMMGVASPIAGRMIDRFGGRSVMTVGSCLGAIACAGLAMAESVVAHLAAWLCLGVAMRLMLYDAAFAALVRIGGPTARGPIAQITLLGGLASTTFWPIGHRLAADLGWRGALFVYSGFLIATVPLHLAIPATRYADAVSPGALQPKHLAATPADHAAAGVLFGLLVALTSLMSSGIAAHMIAILSGLGLAASLAVWTATLTGVAQSLARLGDVLSGSRVHPLDLNLLAAALLPVGFLCGLFSGESAAAAAAFALIYGVANGLLTITRGSLPLVLFDHRSYGTLLGKLLIPSFLLSAASPFAYALLIQRFGPRAALYASAALGMAALFSSLLLRRRFGPMRSRASE
jgi:hypothetical protein